MIQPEKEGVQVKASEDFQSREYGIDEANMGMAYEAFMQYSNPISSIVREVTSNGYDAHGEIETLRDNISEYIKPSNEQESYIPLSPQGSRKYRRWVRTIIYAIQWEDPGVEVEISNLRPPDGQRWIRFTDHGIGLSPERVDTIFCKFFSSTKRKAINQIGYFGLGSKSPLGYTDMFEVTTVFGGTKYQYVIHKAESSPRVTLMSEESTSEGNGTIVRIPIESRSDWHSFVRSVKSQLAYFDNVAYGSTLSNHVENEFTIYRGNHFLYRPDSPFETLHICLGKVYYPIDFKAMDWDEGYSYNRKRKKLKTPISLYFPLEGQTDIPIKVVWNRENVEYSDKTKESMNKKLRMMKAELQDLYDKQFKEISNAEQWVKAVMSKDKRAIPIGDIEIPITPELVDLDIPVMKKYKAFFNRMPTDPFYMLKSHRAVDKGYIDQSFKSVDLKKAYKGIDRGEVFLTQENFSTKKNKYIYDGLDNHYFFIIKMRDLRTDLTDDDDYEIIESRFKRLYLDRGSSYTPSKADLKAMLSFEKELKEHFIEHFKSYDDIDIPDSFNKREKEITKKNKPSYNRDTTFPLKEASLPEYYNEEIGWSRARWKYSKLKRYGNRGTTIIYGFRANEDDLINAIKLLSRFNKYTDYGSLKKRMINVVKIAKNREGMFKDYPNFIHVEDFWDSDHTILKRAITAKKLDEILPKSGIFTGWGRILPSIKDTYDWLKTYVNRNKVDKGFSEDWLEEKVYSKTHLINHKLIRKAEWCIGAVLKYPILIYLTNSLHSTSDLPQIGLRDELESYIEAKGPIDLHLHYRLHKHKEKTNESTEDSSD